MMLSVRRVWLLLALVALLGGCVRIGSAPSPSALVVRSPLPIASATSALPAATPRPTPAATPTPTASPTPGPTATPNDGAQVIDVTLADNLTIEPSKMTVTAGQPVRFVVTNDGALDHDFFVGSDKEQRQRESGTGEPGKDRFIAVPPGETVVLTMTFPTPGKTIAGCPISGQYSAGMKSNITIKAP